MMMKKSAWAMTATLAACITWIPAAASAQTQSHAPVSSAAQTQTTEPAAPEESPATAEAQAATGVPAAPRPQAGIPEGKAAEPHFPAPDLHNFSAASPSREEVNSFLHALWGFNPERVWSVEAILKTQAPGVSKVVVFVANKNQPEKMSRTTFFTTPDGKHVIAGDVMDFGAKPFAANRQMLEDGATGPARGAAGKNLLFVEFADLQCPECKAAQTTVNQLLQDFPQARLVFEDFPLTHLHPFAMQAATEGVCVRQEKGDAAFFTYLQAVYEKQASLTPEGAAAALAAAATAAGADPAKAASCADTQQAKDAVNAVTKLATDVGVEQEPSIAVNGHLLPLTGVPYAELKRIIAFQGREDGLDIKVQPTLSNVQ